MSGVGAHVKPCATCKQRKVKRTAAAGCRSRAKSAALPVSLLTPIEDRAIACFVHHYVFDIVPGIGNHVYLPILLQRQTSTGLIKTVAAATGLAALANTANSPRWQSLAYRLYGKAVRQLRLDLGRPCNANSDEVLGSILLLATFENKGYVQFGRDRGLSASLAMQLRGAVIMTCHELQEPTPAIIDNWHCEVQDSLPDYNTVLTRLGHIEKQLIAARAVIKHSAESDPATIINALRPLDKMLEGWEQSLPSTWAVKSYKRLPSEGAAADNPISQYHVYPTLYIAVMWNAYRSYRVLIHETIIATLSKCSSAEELAAVRLSLGVAQRMADDICQSAPYFLSYKQDQRQLRLLLGPSHKWKAEDWSATGSHLLFMPLFQCGALSTTQETGCWVACILRNIGWWLGMQLAVSMAMKLEPADTLPEDSRQLYLPHT
ncbi:hypothetical protein PWT90_06395 [Aphanocladium album]|nr:hypothetical protein PWT90_06395 [Aphanocladium album]